MENTTKGNVLDFNCCGIFPTNDCTECSQFKNNNVLNKKVNLAQWVLLSERLPNLERPLILKTINGFTRNGNVFISDNSNEETLWISGTPLYEEYNVFKKDFDKYLWLEELSETWETRLTQFEEMKTALPDFIEVYKQMLSCLEQAAYYQQKPDVIIDKAKLNLSKLEAVASLTENNEKP